MFQTQSRLLADPIEVRSTRLYLPSSSAGSSPITPGVDGFWQNTGSSLTLKARLNGRFNTSFEDVSTTLTQYDRVLIRQYVCPLDGAAIHSSTEFAMSLSFGARLTSTIGLDSDPFYGSAFFPVGIWAISYLWKDGVVYRPEATLDQVDVGADSGSGFNYFTLARSGGFSPSDVGRHFILDQLPNQVARHPGSFFHVGGLVSTIGYYVSPDYVETLETDYPFGGDFNPASADVGSNRVLRFIDHSRSPRLLANLEDTPFLNMSVASTLSLHTWDRFYVVIEIGAINYNASDRTVVMRFGDPGEDTMGETGDVADSSGGTIEYAGFTKHIIR